MSDAPAPPEEVATLPPPGLLTRWQRGASIVLGLGAGGAGVAAVFLTSNELGSATLMAAGVYFILAFLLGRFPKLKFGDKEDRSQRSSRGAEGVERGEVRLGRGQGGRRRDSGAAGQARSEGRQLHGDQGRYSTRCIGPRRPHSTPATRVGPR